MEYPQHLLEHLEANPQIEEIHFNSNMEWVFRPRKTHLMTKTRAQVLGKFLTPAEPVVMVETDETVSEKKSKK